MLLKAIVLQSVRLFAVCSLAPPSPGTAVRSTSPDRAECALAGDASAPRATCAQIALDALLQLWALAQEDSPTAPAVRSAAVASLCAALAPSTPRSACEALLERVRRALDAPTVATSA